MFILFWEALMPRPFRNMVNAAKDDLAYIRQKGYGSSLKMAGRIAAAPFIGLAYVASLPLVFFFALSYTAVGGVLIMVGKSASFEWKPLEAYLAGRKKMNRERKEAEKDEGK